MKKFLYIILLASISLVFIRCEDMKDWSDPVDDVPPGKISNPMVENLNGAAQITYSLPSDNDILGVKAVFFLNENEAPREAFSSAFRDTIDLDGFPDTNERIVKLITVDKSKNESEPVEVVVNPLTPAVHLIRESLSVNETFGGLYVTWENPYKEDIGISLFMEDSTGTMVHNYTYFTNVAEQGYSFRGLENTPTRFQIQIRDNWDRYSDPLDTVMTPIYEEYISSKDQYGQLIILQYAHSDGTAEYRGDVPRWAQHTSQDWPDMFDGNIGNMFNTGNQGNPLSQYTKNPADELKMMFPVYFIMDMGRSCKFSRIKFWQWSTRTLAGAAPKHFQLWATNEEPQTVNFSTPILESLAYWTSWPEVGGYDGWTEKWDLIADCWNIPASGQTDPLLISADDVAWAKANGFEHEIFPEFTNKTYRYI
ncbi:MAG: DUF5126 domain-containing protein, partial [Bacteroidales bacterium]|nr:DUF5126 domain-containing protein [Bacteroidales bacterium]